MYRGRGLLRRSPAVARHDGALAPAIILTSPPVTYHTCARERSSTPPATYPVTVILTHQCHTASSHQCMSVCRCVCACAVAGAGSHPRLQPDPGRRRRGDERAGGDRGRASAVVGCNRGQGSGGCRLRRRRVPRRAHAASRTRDHRCPHSGTGVSRSACRRARLRTCTAAGDVRGASLTARG